jgi:hypothetical protein
MSFLRSILLVPLLVVPIGCGGGGSSGPNNNGPDAGSGGASGTGCDTRHCNAIDSLFTCFQWNGEDAFHRDLCAQYEGTLGEGACPTAERVAGCKSDLGDGCSINWSYPPLTDDNVRESCTGEGNAYVTP